MQLRKGWVFKEGRGNRKRKQRVKDVGKKGIAYCIMYASWILILEA
jgi:hypothetical protein